MRSSPVEQLSALEQSLEELPQPYSAQPFVTTGTWLRATSERLRRVHVAEGGAVAYARLLIGETVQGELSRTDEGARRPYRERVHEVEGTRDEVKRALSVAMQRVAGRVAELEKIAEAAIRAAAAAKLLSAPGNSPREQWVTAMVHAMADHPESGMHLARLGLALPGPDVECLVDRVMQRVFGV